jgi:DNA modification methylase
MSDWLNRCHFGDCLETMRRMPDGIVNTCVTSPPYFWQRDYGHEAQIGHEESPAAFVAILVEVFSAVRDTLAEDGTLWLNLGDSYYSGNGQPTGSDPRSPSRDWMRQKKRPLDTPGLGIPKKSLLGLPWQVALALQADGWTLRAEIIWNRATAFSEPSVQDRPYRQHEQIFLLSKSRRYWFDRAALPEESVWTVPHERGIAGHSAAFPVEIPRRCIGAGCPVGGVVLDPFFGSGTTGYAAQQMSRKFIGCELNEAYKPLQDERLRQPSLDLEPA